MVFSQSCACSQNCACCVLECLCFSLNLGCLDHSCKKNHVSFLFSSPFVSLLFFLFPLCFFPSCLTCLVMLLPHFPHCLASLIRYVASLPHPSPHHLTMLLHCLVVLRVASHCLVALLSHIASLPCCVMLFRCVVDPLGCGCHVDYRLPSPLFLLQLLITLLVALTLY